MKSEKIKEVYEKYKNMEDDILSWNSNKEVAKILQDLWTSIKESLGHSVKNKKKK